MIFCWRYFFRKPAFNSQYKIFIFDHRSPAPQFYGQVHLQLELQKTPMRVDNCVSFRENKYSMCAIYFGIFYLSYCSSVRICTSEQMILCLLICSIIYLYYFLFFILPLLADSFTKAEKFVRNISFNRILIKIVHIFHFRFS